MYANVICGAGIELPWCLVQEFMSFLKHADLCTHDFALELVGQEGGFHGKLAYSQQMFAESIGQRFTSSFEVSSICYIPVRVDGLSKNTGINLCA